MTYASDFQRSVEAPEAYWGDIAKQLAWYKAPQTILSTDGNGSDRWFADGELNTCYLAVDYHVEQGRAIKLPSFMTRRLHKPSEKLPTPSCKPMWLRWLGRWPSEVSRETACWFICRWCTRLFFRCWRAPVWVRCIRWCLVDLRPVSCRLGSTMPRRNYSDGHLRY